MVVVGGVVTSAGGGILLPTLLTWVLGAMPFEERGRGTGAWTGSLFIGQFLSALVILAIGTVTGGLSSALVVAGVLTLVLAVVAARLPSVRHSIPAF
ncbi:hypothetical protein QMK17_03920 [Rhodococcus sp. G-MC3]|nr:hypothetical protein [Rhodococcus sp. G-MC3]MDJ0392480.1 hypothetical protein [Rhodococcus sp. G-MC3]